jgi:hypothetical protein
MNEPLTDNTAVSPNSNRHYPFIKNSIPEWLISASATKRLSLKSVPRAIPGWYKTASTHQHRQLKVAMARSWESQNRVDRILEGVHDINRFAEPLLKAALKNTFGLELDVNKTYLRLYMPKGVLRAYDIRTVSLLEAALHNFEHKETEEGFFDSASCFITNPSADGRFDILPIKNTIKIEAFTALCRALDIGGQYKKRLETLLLPSDGLVKTVLKLRVVNSQKDSFRAAAHLALMKGDIGRNAHEVMLGLLESRPGLILDGKLVQCHGLTMMGANLTGIVLIAPNLERNRAVERLIVYIPDDPEHPLKEYASTVEFMNELTRQLRSTLYQRFFSRFVAHEQRGYFFAMLNDRLAKVQWHAQEPFDPRPTWRLEPVNSPNLQFDVSKIAGDLWTYAYQQKLNKILNDARVIAVSTDDEDRKTRWDRWDSLQKIASTTLEMATFVAVPFVPFLGELMLAYTAYQLLDETFTGIVDWAEGQVAEACDHLVAVAENLAQLAAFALVGPVVGKLVEVKPSVFVESLKSVELANGQTRLWQPDLQPYERKVQLPEGLKPNELGLYQHNGQEILQLEGKTYGVEPDPDTGAHRIRHPDRSGAYRPQLKHNGAGTWVHEVERPMEWQGAQLFRRLGHSVAEFSDVTARRILAVSGTDEAVLRRVHVETRRPPAQLEDTIKRFKVDQDIQTFIGQMNSADPRVYAKADPSMQLQLLRLHDVLPQDFQLRNSDVLKTVLETLDNAQIKKLLGESAAFGDPLPSFTARMVKLRNRMAQLAKDNRAELFQLRDTSFQQSSDEGIQRIRRIFPKLPRNIAREILTDAHAADRLHMSNNVGISRRMAEEALWYLREVRLTRAYEGLYLDAAPSPDTDIVALHMLEKLPGWSTDVHIEIRDGHFDGELLDSIGSIEAPTRKVLIKQQGHYLARDASGEELHGLDDFYGAVQHALPDAQRQALGFPHVGQGPALKQAIRQQPLLPRSALRTLLKQPPLEPNAKSPMGLAMGRPGYLLGGGDVEAVAPAPMAHRVRALYPTFSDEEVQTFIRERLHTDPLTVLARLESEYLTLTNDLEIWTTDVPSHHPVTGVALTAEESAAQKRYRALFTQVVQASWSRKLTTDNRFDTGRFFSKLDIIGDLPGLSADFSHISEFLLVNSSSCLRGGNFLKNFPGLKFLTMRGIRLDTFPVETFQMRELISLALDDCNLRLSEATAEGLAHMENLEELDLDNNPLNLTPHVGYMKGLERLQLKSTGLTEVPYGLFELEKLTFADLTFNQIVEVPDELFEVLDTRAANYNFCDNPLSDVSKQRIAEYIQNASLDRKILIQFDEEPGVESEVETDTETDSESEESGVGSSAESVGGDLP